MQGKKYNRLTFIEQSEERKHGNILWKCKCECGTNVLVIKRLVVIGKVQSCGCLNAENRKESGKKNKIHGMSRSKLYIIWVNMKQRCNNPNVSRYKNYGGRGIRYTKDWEDFLDFKKWADDNNYKEGLSIDRINVNGNYEPANCRWVELDQQHHNKSDSNIVEYKGVKMGISELAKLVDKPYHLIYQRIVKLKWNIEDAARI